MTREERKLITSFNNMLRRYPHAILEINGVPTSEVSVAQYLENEKKKQPTEERLTDEF